MNRPHRTPNSALLLMLISFLLVVVALACSGSSSPGIGSGSDAGADSGSPAVDGGDGGETPEIDGGTDGLDAGTDAGTVGEDAGTDAGVIVQTSCSDYSNTQPPVTQTTPLATVYSFHRDYSWTPPAPYGDSPEDALVEGPDGNLYGVTRNGGTDEDGLVYRLSPAGEISVLYEFHRYVTGEPLIGDNPVGSLIVGPDCALYGTTQHAYGASSTAFRITLAGDLNYLAGFTTETGYGLFDRLTLGSDGNFYGEAYEGGAYAGQASFTGTVFRMTPEGTITVLKSFDGGPNGGRPLGGLIEASDGFLYGQTALGGAYTQGTIFKLAKDGSQFQTLWSFHLATGPGSENQSYVTGALVEGADGNLYGTTTGGGDYNSGTIFRITPDGQYTTVHSFTTVTEGMPCNCAVEEPYGPLLRGTDGNLYGVTWHGSDPSTNYTVGPGTVFRMTLDGTVTPLVYGSGWVKGGVIESSDGYLYGTQQGGGDTGDGAVIRVPMSL